MNTIAFDTLAFAKRLQEAGVPAVQAEAHASAQADFLTHHLLSEVATKDDLRIGLAKMETGLAKMEIKMETGLAKMETGLATMETKMEASLAKLETKLTMRMLVIVGALATLMTVFKFIG